MDDVTTFAEHTAAALARIEPGTFPDDADFTIEQRILDGGEIAHRYTVELANGKATLIEGVADRADIVISQDVETAAALRAGTTHAQTAYLTGRLTIDGDVDKLLHYGPALQAIVSALSAARPEPSKG